MADQDTATAAQKVANEQLEGDLKKANADLAGLDAKLFPMATQRRDLMRTVSDPKTDDTAKQAAKDSLKKLIDDSAPIEKQYQDAKDAATALCAKQFMPTNATFFNANDDQKAAFNKAGFSCATGEKMVADQQNNQLLSCGMQVKKIRGQYGFGGGFNPGGSMAGPAPCNVGMGNMGVKPLGKVACTNAKNQIVASALIFESKYGRYLAANTRFNFDTDGRVNGWKAFTGPATTEVAIKGDRVVKTTSFKDQQTSKCEWPANGDQLENYYSGLPQKPIESSDLVK